MISNAEKQPKTFWVDDKFVILKLLMKERHQRISIKDALDHAWFVGANSDISKMR
jgi:hypothetical protein